MFWTSLVVQWLTICLLMQGTRVPMVQEDSPCWWATEPHAPQLLKPACRRACAPQQEKPSQWEGQASQLESRLCSPQPEKACAKQWRPSAAKNKLTNEFFKKTRVPSSLKNVSFKIALAGHWNVLLPRTVSFPFIRKGRLHPMFVYNAYAEARQSSM